MIYKCYVCGKETKNWQWHLVKEDDDPNNFGIKAPFCEECLRSMSDDDYVSAEDRAVANDIKYDEFKEKNI